MASLTSVIFMSVPISHFSFRFVDSGLTWHGRVQRWWTWFVSWLINSQYLFWFVLVVFFFILPNCSPPSIKTTWSLWTLCFTQPVANFHWYAHNATKHWKQEETTGNVNISGNKYNPRQFRFWLIFHQRYKVSISASFTIRVCVCVSVRLSVCLSVCLSVQTIFLNCCS